MRDQLFIILQMIAPQHFLSRVAGWFADTKISWIKAPLIAIFIKAFKVNMAEAQYSDPKHYECFNDFFCRALKNDARPIEDGSFLVSPADGAISQAGKIEGNRIFQAKGRRFSSNELLAGDHGLAEEFIDGDFATIYLAPKDYHRLHMPIEGTLLTMTHVPGDLFSVNPVTAENIESLFARNERVICVFETPAGKMALVLVGAMIVASIETKWAGLVAPAGKGLTRRDYQGPSIHFGQGEEFARFKLGSTIIILAQSNVLKWHDKIQAGRPLKMGEAIASPANVSPSEDTLLTTKTDEVKEMETASGDGDQV